MCYHGCGSVASGMTEAVITSFVVVDLRLFFKKKSWKLDVVFLCCSVEKNIFPFVLCVDIGAFVEESLASGGNVTPYDHPNLRCLF